VLKMDPGAVSLVGKADGTPSTAFYLEVNSHGEAAISARLKAHATDSLYSGYGLNVIDGKVSAAKLVHASDPAKTVTPTKWTATIKGASSTHGKDGRPETADFELSTKVGGTTQYLRADGDTVTLGTTPQRWTLSHAVARPEGLVMNDVSIPNTANNGFYTPVLAYGSSPLTWSIVKGTLPEFLKLTDDGTITWAKPGKVPQTSDNKPFTLARTSYTLQVANSVGKATADFTLEVVAPVAKVSK
jgi:hypothetical protein